MKIFINGMWLFNNECRKEKREQFIEAVCTRGIFKSSDKFKINKWYIFEENEIKKKKTRRENH